MAISKTEIARIKQLRGDILFALYNSPGNPMKLRTIELALLPSYPQIGSDMLPQINWLIDRGYIKNANPEDELSGQRAGDVLVRITDAGQDIIMGKRDEWIDVP